MKLRKLMAYSLLTLLIIISVFGLRPFQQTIDAEKALVKQAGVYVTEVRRLPDASYLVVVRTPMPEVKADMLRWWLLISCKQQNTTNGGILKIMYGWIGKIKSPEKL